MRSHAALVLGLSLCATLAPAPSAQRPLAERVPGATWMRFVDPSEAGFDPIRLEAARRSWEDLPSSAFLVIADGAVVAAWGEIERRFMCHSVRKSFLAALYGVYWDRGELELNKTLFDLGIDDEPNPLLATEKNARILDLLKARSGVFHPAAYAGRTDSRPRGSEGPGRYFAYNNWDFNTLATILERETGEPVFEAFDQYFGRPLGMQDWRVTDGYYHFERDKSQYPAYPFRMSARDAARFGLLYARRGAWGDRQILSKHWVNRCSALYSIDSEIMGYGFMWWVFREPRFARHGMVAALGVGNQMIAALTESDIVIVNRANTYAREATPMAPLLDLIESVLDARSGTPAPDPRLVPLAEAARATYVTHVAPERLERMLGEWTYPPPVLGLRPTTTATITRADGHVMGSVPNAGTFDMYLQPNGALIEDDSLEVYYPIDDEGGAFAGIATAEHVMQGALVTAAAGKPRRAESLAAMIAERDGIDLQVGHALLDMFLGEPMAAERLLQRLASRDARQIESNVNDYGSRFLATGQHDLAREVFQLNTNLFPTAFNAWDSLAEAHMALGDEQEARRCYELSLALNEDNTNARQMLTRIQKAAAGE